MNKQEEKRRSGPTFLLLRSVPAGLSPHEQVLNRLPTMPSSGNVPTVPPKRMSVRGSKAIRPRGRSELAMDTLLRGLRYSKYAILREVVE